MPLDQIEEGNEEVAEKEMTFIEHLEELRWHILRSAAAILIFTITAFVFIKDIYKIVLMAPSRPDFWTFRMLCKLSKVFDYKDLCVEKLNMQFQSIDVGQQFTSALFSSFVVGLVFAFPYTFWEIWRFIMPGLKTQEKKAARGAVFYVVLLLALGLMFGYYIVSPLAINFLANFTLDESIQNIFSISSYIDTLVMLTLVCGLAFQLPIIIFVLSKAGIVTPKFLKEYRKHSYIIILIVAGIITPSPDVLSQVLVCIPLIFLFEISIGVSARVEKQREKDFIN